MDALCGFNICWKCVCLSKHFDFGLFYLLCVLFEISLPFLPQTCSPFFLLFIIYSRSPALIGCFVVDRKYFEEIGLLDEGMEIYGGENVELGIRVSLSLRICMLYTAHQ